MRRNILTKIQLYCIIIIIKNKLKKTKKGEKNYLEYCIKLI